MWWKLSMLCAGLLLSCMAQAKLQLFTCEPEWAELARELGGEHIDVFSATTARQDVHHIQARPSLIAKLRRADLLVCSGAGLEAGWLPVLLRRANNPRVLPGQPGHLDMSRHVDMMDARASVDRAEGDVHPEGNPHFQLDPRHYERLARVLAERMALLDPDRAGDYNQAATAFNRHWEARLEEWQTQAAPLRGASVVAHHLDWAYLFDWLGIEQVATLEPKPGVPPSTGHLSQVLDTLQSRPAACVLRTVYQPGKPSAWLAGRAAINATVIPHTVGVDETVPTLPALFDGIVTHLLEHCR